MKLKNWMKSGLIWGTFMFVSMSIIYPLLQNETLTLRKIVIGLIIWTIGGLLFGKITNKSEAKEQWERLDEGIENIDYLPENKPESFEKN